jgi:hypothetical protein
MRSFDNKFSYQPYVWELNIFMGTRLLHVML